MVRRPTARRPRQEPTDRFGDVDDEPVQPVKGGECDVTGFLGGERRR